jgi:hypothetical protein
MLCAVLFFPGCGQDPPPGDADSGETGEAEPEPAYPEGTEETSYFPLVDGATWTYNKQNFAGQVTSMELMTAESDVWDGKDVIIMTDSPSLFGNFTQGYIYRDGTAATRIHKVATNTDTGVYSLVDYDPGFMRADDGWDTVGEVGELTYERIETAVPDGIPDVEMRGHKWTVVSLTEAVTVPAGTFSCIHIIRERTTGPSAGEKVEFWYAAGVGKVREENPADQHIEELKEFNIPGGLSGPIDDPSD